MEATSTGAVSLVLRLLDHSISPNFTYSNLIAEIQAVFPTNQPIQGLKPVSAHDDLVPFLLLQLFAEETSLKFSFFVFWDKIYSSPDHMLRTFQQYLDTEQQFVSWRIRRLENDSIALINSTDNSRSTDKLIKYPLNTRTQRTNRMVELTFEWVMFITDNNADRTNSTSPELLRTLIQLIPQDSELAKAQFSLLTLKSLSGQQLTVSENDLLATLRSGFARKVLRTSRSAELINSSSAHSQRRSSSGSIFLQSMRRKRNKLLSHGLGLKAFLAGSPPEDVEEKKGGRNLLRKRRYGDLGSFDCSSLQILARDLAQVLTSLSLKYFRQISLEDLVDEQSRGTCAAFNHLVELFNKVSWWTITYILKGDSCLINKIDKIRKMGNFTSTESFRQDVGDRTFRLRLLLDVAEQLRTMCSFHMFFAVMGGLNQPHLDWIWAFVKEKHKLRFQSLNRAVKPDNNYIVYKADLSKAKTVPHVPYLGLLNRELYFLEMDNSELVPVEKLNKRAELIKEFMGYEADRYSFEADQNCQAKLQPLARVLEVHLKAVETAGEQNLLELSKLEKLKASKHLVTGLQTSGFM